MLTSKLKNILSGSISAEEFKTMVFDNTFECLGEAVVKALQDMKNYEQNPKHHAEGNVLEHTALVVEEMSKRNHDWVDMLSAIFHDIGKPIVGKVNPKSNSGYTLYLGHATAGAKFLEETLHIEESDLICYLVRYHMLIHSIRDFKSKTKIWDVLQKPNAKRLVKLGDCDTLGSRPIKISLSELIEKEGYTFMLNTPLPPHLLTKEYIIKMQIRGEERIQKMYDVAYCLQIDQEIGDIRTLYKRVKSIK